MSPSTPTPLPRTVPDDPDLVVQARTGHGVPSQDPNPHAQTPIRPEEAAEGDQSVLVGGAAVGAAAAPASASPGMRRRMAAACAKRRWPVAR